MIDEKLIVKIVKSIREYWDLPAFTNYPGPSISYADVAGRILWLHRIFKDMDIKKGTKIALAGKNCSNWGLVWLSAVTYGATIVPILANFSPEDTQHIINHSDAELAFISKDKYDNIDGDQLRNVRFVLSLDDFTILEEKFSKHPFTLMNFTEFSSSSSLDKDSFDIEDVCDNEDIASIIYTSGTTGFSKGVMLPHRSLLANLIVAHNHLLFNVGAKVLAFLPLAHAYACSFDLLYPVTRGNHINFLDRIPAPKLLLAAMKDLQPEIVLTVPLLIEKIYKKQLQPVIESPKMRVLLKIPVLKNIILKKIHDTLMQAFGGNIRELITGGAPMNAEVEHFMKKIKFPFTIGYGMTECGPLISYANWNEHRFESSGKQVEFLQIKVESEDPHTIPGEIKLRGEQVFKGYYKFDEATAEVLRDGWLYTGDIGTIDKDGFVYIRGRSKNVILGPSGENIYPELVEQKMNNMPYVGESLVLERNRQLHVMIYPDFEALDNDHIPESQIPKLMEKNRSEVNKQLADFSRIIKVQIASEPFQKTPTQKIKRYLYS
ncbi:MAG: AMP-binding protein [Candidatus Cloacimonetes bacterium]|nr:AMP-binding protein [Candidatus Cloacimonadota bacterium]MDD2506756.1 AMP-binding protein [Candidatus Cloacimonadota bacterium]MDD4560718.1 AMP-binding protein [Candidatus Cloacimonadota bacterium]